MAPPNIKIAVEPFEAGKAEYLPLGADQSGGVTGAKIVLRLRLDNTGATAVNVTGIKFSFPGSIQPASIMKDVNLDGSLNLAAGTGLFWSNGAIAGGLSNTIYLTGTPPTQIRIDITAKDFADPATLTLPLASHKSPVAGDAYRFIFAAGDLRATEYMQTSAVHWANGGTGGTQIFAHDIGAVGWDQSTHAWSEILPGTDGKKNADYRIWGKPVRAAADGTVVSWFDTLDENTELGKFPTPTPNPGTGNNILVRHGTEVIRYCHFRKDSIPAALKQAGAQVLEGQELGRAGNSGNSTNPHTHIEAERASDFALRPLPFRDAWVIDKTLITAPPSNTGPWYKLNKQGIPKDVVAIWPAGSTVPGFPCPAAGFSISGDWESQLILSSDLATFSATAQDLFDHKGLRLISVTTYVENGQRRWAGVAREGTWANQWWVSNDLASFEQQIQTLFDTKGLRLAWAHTFLEGGAQKFVGISRAGTWANRLIVHDNLAAFSAEAQSLFDNQGQRLINVTTWLQGTTRFWLGITQGEATWANHWWISNSLGEFTTEVQRLFDSEGKRLSYFTTYVEAGQRRWVGIARSGDWAHRFYVRSDLDAFKLQAQQYLDHQALRLEQVEFFE